MNKPYVKVGWNDKDEILASFWQGFFSLEEIVATGNRLIQIAKTEQARKVLYDTTAMEILDETSQRFIAGEFTRHMVEAGILFSATIVPKDFMAKTAVEKILDHSPKEIMERSKIFESFDSGLRWLRKKEVSPLGKAEK
jgi:hypothetical protein